MPRSRPLIVPALGFEVKKAVWYPTRRRCCAMVNTPSGAMLRAFLRPPSTLCCSDMRNDKVDGPVQVELL